MVANSTPTAPPPTTSARGGTCHARHAIEDTGETIDEEVFGRLAQCLAMVSGDCGDPQTYDRVAKAIQGRHCPVFYLEIPPSLFGPVVRGLAHANLTTGARVVVEKPFGHDLASAQTLNEQLRDERQIFRIDHFLGMRSGCAVRLSPVCSWAETGSSARRRGPVRHCMSGAGGKSMSVSATLFMKLVSRNCAARATSSTICLSL
jgi:hypothetical protein